MRDREESLWARRQADVVGIEAADVKKRSGDVMAYTIRQRAGENNLSNRKRKNNSHELNALITSYPILHLHPK